MEVDIHYYGTYAMAKAAGFQSLDAWVIAYSAQFVDDSTKQDSKKRADNSLLYGIATAHCSGRAFFDNFVDNMDTDDGDVNPRRVWVPFHFFPGGEGNSFLEKVICRKDSELVQEMFKHHMLTAKHKNFFLQLVGIASHVYMDTFAHYGFSGLSSMDNQVKIGSIDFAERPAENIVQYIEAKKDRFFDALWSAGGKVGGLFVSDLGHVNVASFPDRPYLHWSYEPNTSDEYANNRIERNNPRDYLEACEKLYNFFCETIDSSSYPVTDQKTTFDAIKDEVYEILKFQGTCDERCQKWKEFELASGAPDYDATQWEDEKNIKFSDESISLQEAINLNVYRFHQAAAYHRFYVLKDLLPSYGIAVY